MDKSLYLNGKTHYKWQFSSIFHSYVKLQEGSHPRKWWLRVPSGFISHMAGWKIPQLNGGFQFGQSPISMVHVPARHVWLPEGREYGENMVIVWLIPSGNCLQTTVANHDDQWENSLFLWPLIPSGWSYPISSWYYCTMEIVWMLHRMDDIPDHI